MRKFRFAMLGLVLCVVCIAVNAQRKSYVFHGKVESVNLGTKRLTVLNEKIEGWMDPMSMAYAVENEDVLKQIKAGDLIVAKVYDGDYVLHEVKVVPPAAKKK